MLFETLFIMLKNHGVTLWEFIPLAVLTHLRINKHLFCFCFLKFLHIFKEPSVLKNLVFTLIEVKVMAASNSDAYSKKVRQSFALQVSQD